MLDYPQIIKIPKDDIIANLLYKGMIIYPIVDENLRNYKVNEEYEKKKDKEKALSEIESKYGLTIDKETNTFKKKIN